MGTLVLLRHGESEFNAGDRFAGHLDVPLTVFGRQQARRAGALLAEHGLVPDRVFTSPLSRALDTARLLLDALGRPVSPVVAAPLVERHYGALQGRRRAEVLAEFGAEQFAAWRRSWDVAPPPACDGPVRGESLRDVADRLLPYWSAVVEPELQAGGCVVVVSHGNALRVVVRHLEGLSDEATARRQIPIAVPFRYRWRAGAVDGAPSYFDPVAAAAGGGPAGPRRRTRDAENDQGQRRAKAASAIGEPLGHRPLGAAPDAASPAHGQAVGRDDPRDDPGTPVRRQVEAAVLRTT